MTEHSSSPVRRIITQAEAESVLRPYRDGLLEAIRIAFESWLKFSKTLRFVANGRTRANYIWEVALQEMRQRFPKKMRYRRGRWLFKPSDLLTLVVKRLDRTGFPRTYPTQAALAFFEQQIPLPSIEVSGFRGVVGYTLDSTGTELLGIEILLPTERRKAAWRFDLEAEVAPVVSLPAQPKPATRKKRVKVRGTVLEQASETGSE